MFGECHIHILHFIKENKYEAANSPDERSKGRGKTETETD
jgi:hypothetical protein